MLYLAFTFAYIFLIVCFLFLAWIGRQYTFLRSGVALLISALIAAYLLILTPAINSDVAPIVTPFTNFFMFITAVGTVAYVVYFLFMALIMAFRFIVEVLYGNAKKRLKK